MLVRSRRALLAATVAAAGSAGMARAQSAPPAGAAPAGQPAQRVQGTVYDSLARRPLAGALVQIIRTDDAIGVRSATTDSLGRFAIDSLTPGRYVIGFLHPVLDLLDLDVSPRTVELAPGGDGLRVALALPDVGRVRTAICGQGQPASDSTGLLAGRVRDAESDAPVANATVVLTWTELTVGAGGVRTERRRVPVTTTPAGTYLVCGVPAGDAVAASASAPGRESGVVDLLVPPRGLLVRDFALGDTVTSAVPTAATTADADKVDKQAPRLARGTARLTGTVRGPDGRPVRGARTFVLGTSVSAATGDSGIFALDALPAGTRTLEVRAIGFAPRRVAVDLAGGRPATADVRLERSVPTLDRVVVMGQASRRTRLLDEFLERKQRNAFGRFITAADIERTATIAVTDALRMTPGVRVVPTGGFGNALLLRGNCVPAVILDGVPITDGAREIDTLVSPQQVAGIEVYTGAGAPPQYGGIQANGCGVVLLWTKR